MDSRSFDFSSTLPTQVGSESRGDESSLPEHLLTCGSLVLISASLNGKEQGYVMATASAEFEIVPFDPKFPGFYRKHFLFQIICVQPPKRLANKKIYAFRNQRFDVFMSSSRKSSLVARKKLGNNECFDISTPQWKIFQRGFTKPTPLSYKTLSKRKKLRLFSSKTHSPLTFTLQRYEEIDNAPPCIVPYPLPFEFEKEEEEQHDFLSTLSGTSHDSSLEDLEMDFEPHERHSEPSPREGEGKKHETPHHRRSEMGQVVEDIGGLFFHPSSPRGVEVPEDLLRVLTKGYDEWAKLSDYFVSHHFKKLKLPHVIEVKEDEELHCPHFDEESWSDDGELVLKEKENSQYKTQSNLISKIEVLKRFNSRKQPHLVRVHVASGQSEKFIFKEDDNVAMDVVVMDLIKRANAAWKKKGLFLRHRTYTIVATTKRTGFLECVPGDTVLKFSREDMFNSLERDVEKWTNFLCSVFACMVMTAAFMITDRHHNNVMFTPDGDLCMIDLSASLGNKAPMDGVLHMNPVYLPKRIMGLCATAAEWRISPSHDIETLATEELLMVAYYTLLRDESVVLLCKLFNWELPNAHKFLGWTQSRIVGHKQTKEGLRNKIVKTMDQNQSVNNAVAFITSILPIN